MNLSVVRIVCGGAGSWDTGCGSDGGGGGDDGSHTWRC